MKIDRILVPTDFSNNAKAAVDYACELGRQFNSELHFLNVVENMGVLPMEMELLGASSGAYDVVEAENQATRLLADFPGKVECDCPVVRSVEIGRPRTEVTRYAREKDIDLIIISTHGRTGLSHLLMGSVAESVVRKAPCPVLTVRPEGHQFSINHAVLETELTEPVVIDGQSSCE